MLAELNLNEGCDNHMSAMAPASKQGAMEEEEVMLIVPGIKEVILKISWRSWPQLVETKGSSTMYQGLAKWQF